MLATTNFAVKLCHFKIFGSSGGILYHFHGFGITLSMILFYGINLAFVWSDLIQSIIY